MSTTETTEAAKNEAGGSADPTDEVARIDVDHPAPVIEPPRKRTAKTPKASRGNFEMQTWLFMRLSGIVLVVLVLGHLLIQLVLDGGVSKIGFAFVAGRWPRRSGRCGTC